MSAKQPTLAQVRSAAHVLENFAKKGMVGYKPPTMQGGKAKSKAKPKAKTAGKSKSKTNKRK